MHRSGILLFFFLLTLSTLHATHIVGGEMNYTCLGNNEYEITLTIFRDCYNGAPGAFFDDPASIGIFHGQTNALINEVLIPFDPDLNDTLDPILSSECFVAPPDVCVHTTTYTTIVNLSPQIGGYTLAYQRCCRNMTITNIVDPLGTGATYSVYISETALLECNSNPKFNTWPPIYICVNEPISFDQSAYDIDGDSIVYTLCTPLDGAIPADPMPQPPYNPPYNPITWIDPPYNVSNMLNGSTGGVPLSINPQTGLLTGLPNTIGQFVVGICVDEYRNGALISTTRRDFQYNVGECGQTISSFFAPEIQCGDLNVAFENLSVNADEYLWDFNDPGNPGATSTLIDPVYTFSDTGAYTIMLIAEPGNVCADTFYQSITLLPNTITPAFDYEIQECVDSIVIVLTDLSTDTLSTLVGWAWEIGGQFASNEQNPVIVLFENQNALLNLTVTAANGCKQETAQWIPAFLIEEEIADTLIVCQGDSIPLNPQFDPNLDYVWSPAATLSDPVAPNPWASPEVTTLYSVTLTNFTGCTAEKAVFVYVPEPLTLDLPADTTLCDPLLTLTAETNTGTEFYWAEDPDFDVLIGLEPSIGVEPLGTVTYYVMVRDASGCAIMGEVTITGNGVNILVDSTEFICLGDTLSITVANTDPADQVTYLWSPDSLILSGQGSSQLLVSPQEGGGYQFYLESANQWDCSRIDTIPIDVIDTTDLQTGFAFQQCNGFAIQFDYSGPNASIIEWNFGDPTAPGTGAAGPSSYYIYPDTGWYTVLITLPAEVACPDTAFFPIYVGNPGIELAFDWTFPVCSDSVVVQFNNLSTNNQGVFTSQQWFFSNGQSSEDSMPEVAVYTSQSIEAQLIMESSDGCVDTLVQSLEVQLLDPSLPDTVIVCFQEALEINPDYNPDWVYQWSPPEGLSGVDEANPLAGPDQTTTYSVTITDPNGPDTCSVVRAVTVVVPPPFDWQATGDTIVCEPWVTLETQSDAAVSVAWSQTPDFSILLGTDDTFSLMPGRPSTVYVQAVDAFGCVLTDTILAGNYDVALAVPPIFTICVGDSLLINVLNLYPDDILSFYWEPMAGILSGQGTATPLVSPLTTTTYTYLATNQYGCQDTGQVLVNIFDFVPPLQALADPDTIVAGQSSQLLALTGPDNPDPSLQYIWTPTGSLSDAGIFNPVATPTETTLYEVLIITPDGCSNRETVLVVVIEPTCEEPFLFIPSGFSPNGDGKNELFRVRGNFIDEVYLAVYDRWGEKVFETEDVNGGWNGTYQGKLLPPDVYGYYLRVLCFGGDEFIRKGNITLIR